MERCHHRSLKKLFFWQKAEPISQAEGTQPIYRQLDSGKSEIRLLVVKADRKKDPV
jgi:hypothetical protein